jgi:hypothetical protein
MIALSGRDTASSGTGRVVGIRKMIATLNAETCLRASVRTTLRAKLIACRQKRRHRRCAGKSFRSSTAGVRRRHGNRRFRGCGSESDFKIYRAKSNSIPCGEFGAAGDALAIDKTAVGATEVGDDRSAVFAQNKRVKAGDARLIQDEIV